LLTRRAGFFKANLPLHGQLEQLSIADVAPQGARDKSTRKTPGESNFAGFGESAGALFAQFESAPLNPEIRPDAEGFLKLSKAGIFEVFAQDLTDAEKSMLLMTQGPISGAALGGVVTEAAWKTKPSWYLIGDLDRAIPRINQERMATRMNAIVAHANASHVAMLAQPEAVANHILSAAGQSIADGQILSLPAKALVA
jgi:pimeloyl-ACP methyl ester carboxylesterase